MARRRRKLSGPPPHSVLSPDEVSFVKQRIDKLEMQTIAHLARRDFKPMDVVESLVPADTIRILKEAHGKLYHPADHAAYGEFRMPTVPAPLTLYGNFDKLCMAPPANFLPQDAICQGLLDCLNDTLTHHKAFQKVRNVFAFLNRHGTPGAMRYYWPTVTALMRDESTLAGDGVRYRDPPGIGPWITAIRETSATIASALLMPDTEPDHEPRCFSCRFVYRNEDTAEMVYSETWDLI